MKLVIISDIHGNHDALRVLPEEYDEDCFFADPAVEAITAFPLFGRRAD